MSRTHDALRAAEVMAAVRRGPMPLPAKDFSAGSAGREVRITTTPRALVAAILLGVGIGVLVTFYGLWRADDDALPDFESASAVVVDTTVTPPPAGEVPMALRIDPELRGISGASVPRR